jgi:hypothetical protein
MARFIDKPVPVPIMTKQGSGIWFRHERHSDVLLCFLKGVKLISTLNAAFVLLRHGYIHEIGVLFRVAEDSFTDISFMLLPHNADKASEDQQRFFEDFFQEEFEDPAYPLGANQKRDSVPRRKIFSAFGQLVRNELNPSDAQSAVSTIHKTYSGYVHGAYPHIMELYGGAPPHFHMSGMLNTPKIDEWRKQFTDQLYRGIMVSELVARKLELDEVRHAIRHLLREYEMKLELTPTKNAAALIQRVKS